MTRSFVLWVPHERRMLSPTAKYFPVRSNMQKFYSLHRDLNCQRMCAKCGPSATSIGHPQYLPCQDQRDTRSGMPKNIRIAYSKRSLLQCKQHHVVRGATAESALEIVSQRNKREVAGPLSLQCGLRTGPCRSPSNPWVIWQAN